MGHIIEEIALKRGHQIVSIIDVNNMDDFDSDAFRSADVAIEFTNPTAAYGNYLRAWEQGVKVVSGSTGFELFAGRGHFLGGQQIPGAHHEPLPRLRRERGGNAPHS